MGLKPPFAQAEARLRGVNLLRACLGMSPPCPQVSDGNISGAPELISTQDLSLLGCALWHSWRSPSSGHTWAEQVINCGLLALPLAQPQRGLSSAGLRGVQSPVPALPCLGVIISSLGEALLLCGVEEIHYLEPACSQG